MSRDGFSGDIIIIICVLVPEKSQIYYVTYFYNISYTATRLRTSKNVPRYMYVRMYDVPTYVT